MCRRYTVDRLLECEQRSHCTGTDIESSQHWFNVDDLLPPAAGH